MPMRLISLEELLAARFPDHDVLSDPADILQREHDLRSAMAYTHIERDEVGIILRLATGEEVEFLADFIEYEGPLVELKGGHTIPVRSILRIEI